MSGARPKTFVQRALSFWFEGNVFSFRATSAPSTLPGAHSIAISIICRFLAERADTARMSVSLVSE